MEVGANRAKEAINKKSNGAWRIWDHVPSAATAVTTASPTRAHDASPSLLKKVAAKTAAAASAKILVLEDRFMENGLPVLEER
jgi:hypothetical protein